MKNQLTITAALLCSLAFGAYAVGNRPAQPESVAKAAKPATIEEKTAPTKSPMADGEIKKIDKDAGKVTIKHGEIKNLDMPSMTMVFRVKDAAMLDQIKVGDKINFSADKINGNFTVTKMEAAKMQGAK